MFQLTCQTLLDHSKFELKRGGMTTNSLEVFSVLKRGLVGTYHRVGARHLDRYLVKFDFRNNNRVKLGMDDEQRADVALRAFAGKRLTYGITRSAVEA
jgi:ISXO2-like transposase domain